MSPSASPRRHANALKLLCTFVVVALYWVISIAMVRIWLTGWVKKIQSFFHSEGVRQQVPAERERRAVFGAALRDLVPVRGLSLPTPLHADYFHRFQKVIHTVRVVQLIFICCVKLRPHWNSESLLLRTRIAGFPEQLSVRPSTCLSGNKRDVWLWHILLKIGDACTFLCRDPL